MRKLAVVLALTLLGCTAPTTTPSTPRPTSTPEAALKSDEIRSFTVEAGARRNQPVTVTLSVAHAQGCTLDQQAEAVVDDEARVVTVTSRSRDRVQSPTEGACVRSYVDKTVTFTPKQAGVYQVKVQGGETKEVTVSP